MAQAKHDPDAEILFVTRKWAPAIGGMETYCLRLVEELRRRRPVDIVVLPGREDGRPPPTHALLGFPLTFLRRYLARAQAPAVLHLADMAIWPLALPALLSRHTRIVLSAHGTDVSYHRRGGLKGRLYGIYLRLGARLLRRAKIIANSRATRDVLAETGWETTRVVPLATDAPGGAQSSTRHNGRVLFAGRLVERKGCGWFAREVLPLLPETIGMDVAGTGWDPAERAAIDTPRVAWLGSLRGAELQVAYREALCVAVPNIAVASGEYEGFGLVAPEAAVAGGVVLAADRDGLRDAVMDGETGMLIESGNPRAWADAVIDVASWSAEQRTAFIEPCRQAAAARYSWKRVAEETESVYAP